MTVVLPKKKGRLFLMKSIKITGVLLAAVLVLSAFAGCQKVTDNSSAAGGGSVSSQTDSANAVTWTEPVKVAALKGPTALGMLNMMEEEAQKDSTLNPYQFTVAGKPEDVVAKLTSKEVDIAAIPTNLAATLYNKNGSVKMLALNTLGVLYLLEKGDTIKTAADLKGKTIYSTGQGAVPEYALNYVLEQNGLKVGTDVTVEYKTEHSELAALMASNQATIAVLPQPFVTTVTSKNADIRVALDLTKEWEKANSATLTMGCVVVRSEFLNEHADIVDAFMKSYQASSEKAVSNVEATAKLSGKYDIVAEAVAKQAIPQCNIVYIAGTEMETKANSFFEVLAKANAKAVGGKVPDNGIYYIAK